MAVKRGLGRGLDSMIPDIATTEEKITKNVSRETLVSINDIEPNKGQPRKNFDQAAIDELADSIKQFGIIEPLIVRKKGKRYEIIAGERRFRAARTAGLKEVPVIVKDYAEEDVFVIALLENIQRADLNPIEEAEAYQKLISEHNLKQEDVAKKVSKKRATITNSMRLLKLPAEVQNMVASGELTEGHGRALLGLDNGVDIIRFASLILRDKLSVRATEDLVKKHKEAKEKQAAKKEKKAVTPKNSTAAYKAAENKLKAALGTKVEIKNKPDNSGSIEIQYYSIDELDRIIDLIEKIK